jgi:hypothetical protein
VILLHDPAVLVPPDALPGLLERHGGDRGHQHPFQGLFPGRRLRFAHPNGPDLQRFLAEALLQAGRQHRQRAKGELHDRRASLPSMTGRYLERAAGLRRPAAHLIEQIPLRLLFGRGSLGSQTRAPENGSASLGRLERTETYRRHDLRQARPWSGRESAPRRLTRRIHTSVSRSLRCRRWLRVSPRGAGVRTKGSCIAQPSTSPLSGRTASTGRQIQPSSSLIADLAQTLGFGMMAQVHLSRVLYQQNHRPGFNLFARLLPMRLHQCENSSHLLHPAVGTRPSSLSTFACGRARRPKHARPCAWPLSRLVPFDEYP